MVLGPVPTRDTYYTALRSFMLAQLPPGIEIVQAQQNRVPQPAGSDFVTFNEIGRRRLSTNVTTYADCSFVGTVSGSTLTISTIHLGSVQIGNRLLGEAVQDGTAISGQQSGSAGGAGVYTLSVAQQSPISGVPLATGAALISQPTEVTIQTDVYGPSAADNTSILTTLLRDGYFDLWLTRQGYTDQGIGILDVGEPRQMAFIDGEDQYEDRWSFDVKLQANQVTSPSQDFADSINLDIIEADAPGAIGTVQADPATPTPTTGLGSVTVKNGTATPGQFTGFGYKQYVAASASPTLTLLPDVRTPITMMVDPTQTTDTLKAPFGGFAFWDGSLLHARAVGDVYELRLTLTATSAVAGGTLSMDVTIVGLTVATDLDSEALSYPAGQPQRVGFKLRLLPKAGFVSGGAQIFVTSTVPCTITNEVLVIDPSNAGP